MKRVIGQIFLPAILILSILVPSAYSVDPDPPVPVRTANILSMPGNTHAILGDLGKISRIQVNKVSILSSDGKRSVTVTVKDSSKLRTGDRVAINGKTGQGMLDSAMPILSKPILSEEKISIFHAKGGNYYEDHASSRYGISLISAVHLCCSGPAAARPGHNRPEGRRKLPYHGDN